MLCCAVCNLTQLLEGSWALSMREGEGEETWKNGDKYVGQFSRDKMHGLGENNNSSDVTWLVRLYLASCEISLIHSISTHNFSRSHHVYFTYPQES